MYKSTYRFNSFKHSVKQFKKKNLINTKSLMPIKSVLVIGFNKIIISFNYDDQFFVLLLFFTLWIRNAFFSDLFYFCKLFTFFYINRRMYWFRANFLFPVFDGLTRFRMSWTRFDYFWKISVCMCVCDKNFVASVAQKLIDRI